MTGKAVSEQCTLFFSNLLIEIFFGIGQWLLILLGVYIYAKRKSV